MWGQFAEKLSSFLVSCLSTDLPTSVEHAQADGEEYRSQVRFWARLLAYELCLAQTAGGRSSRNQM